MHSIMHVTFFLLNSETMITCAESSPCTFSIRSMTARAILRAWPIRPSYRFCGKPIRGARKGLENRNRCDPLGTIDTVADPDYVTAEASRDRLGLANQAGSLSLALDAADTIQAQDSLEKMLVHQMAVLHYGSDRTLL
jgi:hypothetical protein